MKPRELLKIASLGAALAATGCQPTPREDVARLDCDQLALRVNRLLEAPIVTGNVEGDAIGRATRDQKIELLNLVRRAKECNGSDETDAH